MFNFLKIYVLKETYAIMVLVKDFKDRNFGGFFRAEDTKKTFLGLRWGRLLHNLGLII